MPLYHDVTGTYKICGGLHDTREEFNVKSFQLCALGTWPIKSVCLPYDCLYLLRSYATTELASDEMTFHSEKRAIATTMG